MTYLSSALGNFYERRRGRIFFQNGMSLNQLALEMWERLDYQGVDPSVISRVLKGERLFTPNQLKVFSKILCLPKEKRAQLSALLFRDYSERLFPYFKELNLEPFSIQNKTMDFFLNSLDFIKKIKTIGNRETISTTIDFFIDLFNLTENLYLWSEKKQKQLLRIRGYLLSEKIDEINEDCLPIEITGKAAPVLEKLEPIIEKVNDNNLKARFFLAKGGVFGVKGSYSFEKKFKIFHQRAKVLREKSLIFAKKSSEKIEIVREIIVAAGYLEDKDYLNGEGEKLALDLIEKQGSFSPQHACCLLNSLALSKSIIKDKSSLKMSQKSWEIFKKEFNSSNPWVESHLIRSTLQSMLVMKNKDLGYAQKLMKRMNLISQYCFKRHLVYSQKYYDLLTNESKNKTL